MRTLVSSRTNFANIRRYLRFLEVVRRHTVMSCLYIVTRKSFATYITRLYSSSLIISSIQKCGRCHDNHTAHLNLYTRITQNQRFSVVAMI